MNLTFSKCDQTLKFTTHFVLLPILFTLLSPAFAFAANCTPFALYNTIDHPIPARTSYANGKLQARSVTEWIDAISKVAHHQNFASIYARFKPQFKNSQHELRHLECVYRHLQLDADKDGIKDWKIVSDQQLFSHLLPQDMDWDNDGVENIYDSRPLKRDHAKRNRRRSEIPSHLLLSKERSSRLNQLQDQIYKKCHVLAVNHTDRHSAKMLDLFLTVCKPALGAFRNGAHNFILYAFSSHATKGDIVASFYAESNFMSIGGKAFTIKNDETTKLTIAHEIGHYFTFNYLTPTELAIAAARFGHWNVDSHNSHSFFDSQFLKPAEGGTGFFPTLYARTNIHEWFSEIYAHFLYKRALDKTSTLASNTPSEMDEWILERLSPAK